MWQSRTANLAILPLTQLGATNIGLSISQWHLLMQADEFALRCCKKALVTGFLEFGLRSHFYFFANSRSVYQ
jgi:hypothetical protein